MLETPQELAIGLGARIRQRRIALGHTQAVAAERAGVAYRTWRRMEKDGRASIDDLVRAALALSCEADLAALFPQPVARSMAELLAAQEASARRQSPVRRRASPKPKP